MTSSHYQKHSANYPDGAPTSEYVFLCVRVDVHKRVRGREGGSIIKTCDTVV